MRVSSFLVVGLLAGLSPALLQAISQPRQLQQSYPESSQRGNTRIFYWGSKGTTGGSIGELSIDYGQPVWKEEYTAAVEGKRDYRWRLGQNFWTHLDTNIDLIIEGVSLSAGYYYLALEHTSDDEWLLWAIDPQEAYSQKLDAFHAHFTKEGIRIPLQYSLSKTSTSNLSIQFSKSSSERDSADLTIQYGPHLLRGEVSMLPDDGT